MSSPVSIRSSRLGRIVVPDSLPPGVALFWTTRDFPGDLDAQSVESILAVVAGDFGVKAALATCHQVHGVSVVRGATGVNPWCEAESCDALWSDRSGLTLGIKVADCLPVTLIDPARGVIANVHAGWRGAAAGIIGHTVDELCRSSAFQTSQAQAWLGPSIRRCCFEVGEEVVERFATRFGDVRDCVERREGKKPHFDLPRLARNRLIAAGLSDQRIIDSGLCTRCPDSIFHSFRRDGKAAGRNLSIAGH